MSVLDRYHRRLMRSSRIRSSVNSIRPLPGARTCRRAAGGSAGVLEHQQELRRIDVQIRCESPRSRREFKAKPFASTAPTCNTSSTSCAPETWGRCVLVMTRPHEQWTLARLTDDNNGPPRLTNTTFDSLEAAEWGVFKLRWEELAGAPLALD